MRLLGLLFFLFFVTTFLSCQINSSDDLPTDAPYDSIMNQTFAQEVFLLINQHRTSLNLEVLTWNSIIEETSFQHSLNMAYEITEFGHDGFDQRADTLYTLVGGNRIAENVATGYTTAQDVVSGWIASAGHKDNIEGPYTLSAIGIAYNKSGTPFYTQIFLAN